jgi:hypothetical protein
MFLIISEEVASKTTTLIKRSRNLSPKEMLKRLSKQLTNKSIVR